MGDKTGKRIWNHMRRDLHVTLRHLYLYCVGSVEMALKISKTFVYLFTYFTGSDMILQVK